MNPAELNLSIGELLASTGVVSVVVAKEIQNKKIVLSLFLLIFGFLTAAVGTVIGIVSIIQLLFS